MYIGLHVQYDKIYQLTAIGLSPGGSSTVHIYTQTMHRTTKIYQLTAIGLSPGGSSTVHIYTQTMHRTTQNKQYIEQHNNFGRVRAVPRLSKLYPAICPTTEEKARKKLQSGQPRLRIHRQQYEYIDNDNNTQTNNKNTQTTIRIHRQR